MQTFIITFFLCFLLTQSYGQTRKSSLYLQGQYNRTLYGVNKHIPWGMGLGLQFFLRQALKLKPTIDLTADAYFQDDKVLWLNSDGTPIKAPSGVNLFAGGSYHPTKNAYLSVVAGPSFLEGKIKWGVKPSVGFYFPSNQKWTGKVSYINVFNRDKKTKEDFGSISFALGVRLY